MSSRSMDLAAWALRVAPRLGTAGDRRLVLCYHGVGAEGDPPGSFVDPKKKLSPATFRRQLRWLSELGKLVRLDEISEPVPASSGWRFAITFDDGYRNNVDVALPILEEFRAPLTWFVASSYVEDRDRLPWWDLLQFLERRLDTPLVVKLGEDAYALGTTPATPGRSPDFMRLRSRFLDAAGSTVAMERSIIDAARARGLSLPTNGFADPDTVREVATNSLVEIGVHTHNHVNMARTSASDIALELQTNIARIRDWTGRTPREFAYPYGTRNAVSADAAEQVKAQDLSLAVTTRRDYLDERADVYQLPRLTVQSGWSDAVFKSRVKALDRWNRVR